MNEAKMAAELLSDRTVSAFRPLNRLAGARVAVSTLFLADGMAFGTWAALIPSFQQKFALSAGNLSGALAGLVVGAMISMPISGRLVVSRGSRSVCFPAALAFPASLVGLMLAPNFPLLIAAAVLFGTCKGLLDISMNAQGITVETALGKPIISSLNGFWSLGGLLSASVLSFALHQGLGLTFLLGAMSALLVLMTLTTAGRLLPDVKAAAASPAPKRFSLPNGRLLGLGAMAFLALFSEGVLLDWSAVYGHVVAHVSLATAPVAFAAFSICMAGGRFAGDYMLGRWGTLTALRVSAALMVTGTALATLVRNWPAILLGFMIVGFGISNLVPIIFGAASRAHEHGAGPGIATVSTLGYTGFLCGPPLVGALASFAGLPIAFCLLIFFGLAIAVAGKFALAPA